MKYIKLTTLEEYNALNDAVSVSRGYPDERTSTGRYAPDNPEPVEVKDEDDNVIETYYKFELTEDIFAIVSTMAGKSLVVDDSEIVIPDSGLPV